MFSLKSFPSFDQCRKIFRVLNNKEKNIFLFLAIISFVSLSAWGISFYFRATTLVPAVSGKLIEGVIGQPRFINPVLSSANDADRDLTELVFAGLMKYAPNGDVIPDLAAGYEIKDNGKTWEVTLKENLVFQDNTPLTADDVIFTVKTIQNPDYKSPLRASWLGVEVEQISAFTIAFKLKNSYPPFLENLTLKIIPKAIWKQISPENFSLAIFNLKPIGSGPYLVDKIIQEKNSDGRIKSLSLKINPRYVGEAAKIKEISFLFFENENDLAQAAKTRKISSLVIPSPDQKNELLKKSFQAVEFELPRYFAVFLNPKNQILAEKSVRQALNYATDKTGLINNVLAGNGTIVESPLLPAIFGLSEPKNILGFDLAKANEILDKAGFVKNAETNIREKEVARTLAFEFKSKLVKGSQGAEVRELQKCLAKDAAIYPEGEVTGVFGDKTKQAVILFQEKFRQEILVPAGLTEGNGETGVLTRSKLNEFCFGPKKELRQLKFSLITVDDPVLIKTSQLLKEQWLAIGVDLRIESVNFSQLNTDYLKSRNYDALLFGEVLGRTLDPFPFWHSSQKKDPGLNLALYENKEADKLLEEARQTSDETIKNQKLEKFQEIVLNDAAAVFLYQPDFTYLLPAKLKGVETGFIIDPSKRFAGIENWYFKTKRVWSK